MRTGSGIDTWQPHWKDWLLKGKRKRIRKPKFFFFFFSCWKVFNGRRILF